MEPEQDWALRAVSPGAPTTEALGERLGRALVPGTLVALVGELGSGKTTLTRGLARGLASEETPTSPTFTRMRVLPGRLTLYHFDAWRGGADDLFREGADFLVGEGVAVVEWADRVTAFLPLPRLEIELGHLDPERRSIHARVRAEGPATGPATVRLAATLERALAEAARTPGLEFPGGA